MGWRYLYFTSGGLVFILSVARVTVIRFHETPKYLLCKGKDDQVVALLQGLSNKYCRPCTLTIDVLQQHGISPSTQSSKGVSLSEILLHYRGLFSTRKLAYSTTLIWLSWTMIGLAYPLFYVFLPEYLASRGAQFGQTSTSITWRNYVLAQVCAIFGPLIAGIACRISWIGRKYTMVGGALLTSTYTMLHSIFLSL
jgi:hypothetical protein